MESFIRIILQQVDIKSKNRITTGYCRVSSRKQKNDLERQMDHVKTYLIAQGQPFEIIGDIGSGINYKKKGFQELIQEEEPDGKSHKSNADTKQCAEN